jgi:putative ABC transport system permease protein
MIDPEAQKQLREMKGIKSILFACDIPVSIWLTQDLQSEELKAIGGLSRIASLGKYAVYEEKESYRILSNLIALDDISFQKYCSELGIDSELFYDPKNIKTIVVNTVKDEVHSDVRNTVLIPYLNIEPGDQLTCNEKVFNDVTGTYFFTIQAGYVTDQLPALGERYPCYQLAQILPVSVYLDIISHFEEERASRAKCTFIPVVAEDKEKISFLAGEITKICDRWYGSGDYDIMNIQENEKLSESSRKLLQTITLCVASFLSLIGFVNVFTTVSGNLRHRQRDFAMLQSVGLTAKGMRKMMLLEGLLLGLFPIIISLPVVILITGVFLRIYLIHFYEYLPFIPFLPIASYAALIILITILAYAKGIRRLSRISIVDSIKDDTV